MADKFLNAGGGSSDLSNGTINAFIASLTVANLSPSLPVKTNSINTLISTRLDIADVNNLESRLDSVITSPFQGTFIATDFESKDYFSVNDELQKIDNLTASTANNTNVNGFLNAPIINTGEIFSTSPGTGIQLGETDVNIFATNLTFNGQPIGSGGGVQNPMNLDLDGGNFGMFGITFIEANSLVLLQSLDVTGGFLHRRTGTSIFYTSIFDKIGGVLNDDNIYRSNYSTDSGPSASILIKARGTHSSLNTGCDYIIQTCLQGTTGRVDRFRIGADNNTYITGGFNVNGPSNMILSNNQAFVVRNDNTPFSIAKLVVSNTSVQINSIPLLMNNNRIELVANPISNSDAATKSYVDALTAGVVVNPMTADLSGGGNGILGVSFIEANSILLTGSSSTILEVNGFFLQRRTNSNLMYQSEFNKPGGTLNNDIFYRQNHNSNVGTALSIDVKARGDHDNNNRGSDYSINTCLQGAVNRTTRFRIGADNNTYITGGLNVAGSSRVSLDAANNDGFIVSDNGSPFSVLKFIVTNSEAQFSTIPLSMSNQKITLLGAPTDNADAVNKLYVDNAVRMDWDVIPVLLANDLLRADSFDYYINAEVPHKITVSQMKLAYGITGSSGSRVAIYRGEDTSAVLVGQSILIPASSLTLPYMYYTLIPEAGQTLTFQKNEKIVLSVAIAGTNTRLRGINTTNIANVAWTNGTDSANGGFLINPRPKSSALGSIPVMALISA